MRLGLVGQDGNSAGLTVLKVCTSVELHVLDPEVDLCYARAAVAVYLIPARSRLLPYRLVRMVLSVRRKKLLGSFFLPRGIFFLLPNCF